MTQSIRRAESSDTDVPAPLSDAYRPLCDLPVDLRRARYTREQPNDRSESVVRIGLEAAGCELELAP